MYYNFIIYLHNQFFFIREFVGLMHLQSVPNYCFRHILMILKKNKHTCQLCTFEFYEREEIQDFFIDMGASAFIWKNS